MYSYLHKLIEQPSSVSVLPTGIALTALKSTLSRRCCVRSVSSLAWNQSTLQQMNLSLPPSLVCCIRWCNPQLQCPSCFILLRSSFLWDIETEINQFSIWIHGICPSLTTPVVTFDKVVRPPDIQFIIYSLKYALYLMYDFNVVCNLNCKSNTWMLLF